MKFSEIKLPSNKKFGIFFSLVFFLLFIYLILTGIKNLSWIMASLALTFFLISLIKPDILLPLNKLWMRFGFLLGSIISPIVLGILFFLMFTPIAVIMRLFSRDELILKKKDVKSYWKLRDTSKLDKNSFNNQY